MAKEIVEKQFIDIVGSENLITDSDILDRYSKDQSFESPRKPLWVIRPNRVEEVRQIVKIADRNKIPITPYSSGENNQGATIPSYAGLVLDLSRMNHIFEIDKGIRVAVIEPGVTFAQLQDEAKKHRLRVMTPLELPSSASVVSSYLDFVPLYSWPKYGTENLLTMHLVLPNGELLRTGTEAVAHNKRTYDLIVIPFMFLHKVWFGSQGALAVAVRGTVKLKNLHEENKVFFILYDKVEDAFRSIREIKWIRTGEEIIVMNNTELALMLAETLPSDFAELKETLPPWAMIHILRGEENEVDYQETDLQDIASKLDIRLELELKGVEKAGCKILREIEYPQGYKKTSYYKGARNVLQFITPKKLIPNFNKVVYELAEKYEYPRENIGCTLLPVEIGRVHYQYSLQRDPNNSEETERVKKLYFAIARSLIDMGAFFSRPHGPLAQMVFERAGMYHSEIGRFKRLVDPNNIMNPGKLAL